MEIAPGADEVAKQTEPFVDQCTAMFHKGVGTGKDLLRLGAGGLQPTEEG